MCKEKRKRESRVNGRASKGEAKLRGRQYKALSGDDEERIIGTKCEGWWWVKGKEELCPIGVKGGSHVRWIRVKGGKG